MECINHQVLGRRGMDASLSAAASIASPCLLRHRVPAVPLALRKSRRATFQPPAAISYSDEQIFGHRLGLPEQGPPVRELSEEEKRVRVDSEAEKIRLQTEQRSRRLKNEMHLTHLNHELKFGKLMLSQGSFDSALGHFNKVIEGSTEDSYHRCEATLQKAACLENLGREAEAHNLYQSLIRFRAPFPNIKRRAAEALFGTSGEGPSAPSYDEYMYKMFQSGFGSYVPQEKYVQTDEEKTVLSVLPWAILLMAPLLLVGLLLFPQ